MRRLLKILVALACAVYALFSFISGMVFLTSPETASQYLSEGDPSPTAGVIGLVLAAVFLGTAFFIFRRPSAAVLALLGAVVLQVTSVYVMNTGGLHLMWALWCS